MNSINIEDFKDPLLERDRRILDSLIGKGINSKVSMIDPLTIKNLIIFIRDCADVVFDKSNLINRSWLTVGGFIKDIIERDFPPINNLEPINIKSEDISIMDQIILKLKLKIISSKISNYCLDGSFVQLLEDNSPITEILHMRKVSLLFKGLISRNSATFDIRDMNPLL